MAYRNGTYIAFHAEGNPDPTASDIRYYRMIKAWHERDKTDFRFVNSHEKTSAVRDSSLKTTLRRSLMERLNNSRNMLLIIGDTTRFDTDWVPFEIGYAVDACKIPVIAVYTGYTSIRQPALLSNLWPPALGNRIRNGTARVLHIPFKQAAIDDAIQQFDHTNLPKTGLEAYSVEAHRFFGISI